MQCTQSGMQNQLTIHFTNDIFPHIYQKALGFCQLESNTEITFDTMETSQYIIILGKYTCIIKCFYMYIYVIYLNLYNNVWTH